MFRLFKIHKHIDVFGSCWLWTTIEHMSGMKMYYCHEAAPGSFIKGIFRLCSIDILVLMCYLITSVSFREYTI